jgi:hypothetical protein
MGVPSGTVGPGARLRAAGRTVTTAVVATVALLTGCGGADPPTSAAPSATPSATTTGSVPASPPAGGATPSAAPPNVAVPEPFRAACGRPGTQVRLPEPARPYVVPRALCDLTGVTVSYERRGGAEVPPPGEGVSGIGDGPEGGGGIEIQTDVRTGDVSVRPLD